MALKTVVIDELEWTENLNFLTFNNGDEIPIVRDLTSWIQASKEKKPACCSYKNNSRNAKKYGLLYNWHVVNDPRGIAPVGWRIPNREDFKLLENSLKFDYNDWISEDRAIKFTDSPLRYILRLIDDFFIIPYDSVYRYKFAHEENGFAAKAAGLRVPRSVPSDTFFGDRNVYNFGRKGVSTWFWLNKEPYDDSGDAWSFVSDEYHFPSLTAQYKGIGMSVRLVRDRPIL